MSIRHAITAGLVLPLSIGSAAALAQALQSFVGPPQERLHPLGGPGEARAGGAIPALPMRMNPGAAMQSTEEVANPVAPVPAVSYRSVFVDTPTGVETGEVDWKKANADVGQFKRGHIDILQWETRQGAKP